MNQKRKYYIAVFVFLVVPLSGINIDIYVPSLPEVSHYFGVSRGLSQLTITAYLIGLGIMQLLAGSLSDSYGRKKPFTYAMAIYIAATLLIPNIESIYQLIGLRVIQGISLALMVVPMRSVISDLFEGNELQKMMTYLTMAWSIGPIIAPAIGGYLQSSLGWKASFYFLGIYSFIMLFFSQFFLRETSKQQHPFKLLSIVQRYQHMILNKEYFRSIIIGGLLFSLISLFGIVGPFYIQTMLHYSAIEFGEMTLVMGLAWFIGVMSNRFMLHVSIFTKARISFWFMLSIVLNMFIIDYFWPMSIYNIVASMFLLFFFSGILYPSYFIRSVLLFRNVSASANALYNAAAFLIAGIISALGTFMKVDTLLPFIGALLILISLSMILHSKDRHEQACLNFIS